MGKCTFCREKIEYNDFIIRHKKPYHPKCWKILLKMRRLEKQQLEE